MKVHRVDYRLVPGLTHAMAGSLLTRKSSADTLISPSFIGSGIDPVDQNCPLSSAQSTTLTVCLPFQSVKRICQIECIESASQVLLSIHHLRFFLRIGYCWLAASSTTVSKYVKSGNMYFRTPGNYVSFRKLFSTPLI